MRTIYEVYYVQSGESEFFEKKIEAKYAAWRNYIEEYGPTESEVYRSWDSLEEEDWIPEYCSIYAQEVK